MAGGGQHPERRAMVVALLARVLTAGAAAAAVVATDSRSALAAGALTGIGAVTLVLLLAGGRRARRAEPTDEPSGVGRAHYFWPVAVAVILLLGGLVAAVDEGIRLVRDPVPMARPEWAYGALGAGVVLSAVGLRATVRAGDEVRGRATWRRFLRSARSPGLPLAVVEGVGAVAGLALALGATVAAEATGDPAADGIGVLAVAGVMAVLALALLVEVRSLLVGGAATRKDVEAITAAIEVDPAVGRLLTLHTQPQGPETLLVAAKVELDHTLTFPEVCEVVSRIERNVRAHVPRARTMFIEPDVSDERRAAPTVDEHEPGHEVPPAIRELLAAEARRGGLGQGIPVEPDLEEEGPRRPG